MIINSLRLASKAIRYRIIPLRNIATLEQKFSRFEKRCQQIESVPENSYKQLFESFHETVNRVSSSTSINDESKANLSLLASTLLRCCGNLMFDTPPKSREMHAGNIWNFIKSSSLPVDISHYNILIRTMNENNSSFDPAKILAEIRESGINPDRITYQRLIHQYCLQGDIQGATKLLEEMKELGFELNEQIFASLILGYGKQENAPNIKEMFNLMESNGIEPSSKTFASAIISLCHRLKDSPDAEVQLKYVLDQIKTNESQFSIQEIIDILISLSASQKNDTTNELTDIIVNQSTEFMSKRKLFRSLLDLKLYDMASKIFWSKKPGARAIESHYAGNTYIKELATSGAPVDICISECSKIVESGWNPKAMQILYYFAADNGRIDIVKAAIEKLSDTSRINHTYYWPLIAQSKSEQELVEVLKKYISPDMPTKDLLETFSEWVWPKFSDNLSKLFELNNELKYNKGILATSLLNFAVREDKIDDAMKFILSNSELLADANESEEQLEDSEVFDDNTSSQRSFRSRPSMAGALLNQIATDTKSPELVQKAFELCRIPGRHINPHEAKPLVKVHLLNEDYKSAIDTFLKIATQFKVTPHKSALIQHCLETKDPENLQKIIDVTTRIHGQSNALYDLAISCLRCNKTKQAQKILNSLGLRINPSRYYWSCRDLRNKRDVDSLEKLVDFTRNIQGLDHEVLYQMLIGLYSEEKLGKRALDLWNRMQEEDFQPSKKVLSSLAKVLEENGLNVPFQKPSLGNDDSVRPRRTTRIGEMGLMK